MLNFHTVKCLNLKLRKHKLQYLKQSSLPRPVPAAGDSTEVPTQPSDLMCTEYIYVRLEVYRVIVNKDYKAYPDILEYLFLLSLLFIYNVASKRRRKQQKLIGMTPVTSGMKATSVFSTQKSGNIQPGGNN